MDSRRWQVRLMPLVPLAALAEATRMRVWRAARLTATPRSPLHTERRLPMSPQATLAEQDADERQHAELNERQHPDRVATAAHTSVERRKRRRSARPRPTPSDLARLCNAVLPRAATHTAGAGAARAIAAHMEATEPRQLLQPRLRLLLAMRRLCRRPSSSSRARRSGCSSHRRIGITALTSSSIRRRRAVVVVACRGGVCAALVTLGAARRAPQRPLFLSGSTRVGVSATARVNSASRTAAAAAAAFAALAAAAAAAATFAAATAAVAFAAATATALRWLGCYGL